MKRQLFISSLVAALLLAGCVVTPEPYSYYDGPVYVDPPPPRVEYPGYAPVAGYVWIGGYWSWTGHRHEWVPGRWDAPRQGHRWVEPRWEREGRYWRQRPGRWEQDNESYTIPPVLGGPSTRQEPRYPRRDERYDDRHDDRRSPPQPNYRQERGGVPQPARGDTENYMPPAVLGGPQQPPARTEPPRRDFEQRRAPDAGQQPREVRPAPPPRMEQDNRGRDDRQRENRRGGRRGDDDR
jgi:hypothetical protein